MSLHLLKTKILLATTESLGGKHAFKPGLNRVITQDIYKFLSQNSIQFLEIPPTQ